MGELLNEGTHECWTLEPSPPIMPIGRYRVRMQWSPRFNRAVPWVLDVPGHTAIEVHVGNSVEDTHGCILIGANKTKDRLQNSGVAFANLTYRIIKAEKLGDEVWLHVEGQSDDPPTLA